MLLNLLTSLLVFFTLLVSGQDTNSFYFIKQEKPVVLKEDFSANKAGVYSDSERIFLYEKNLDEVQPIASITKLMTAIVFLETKADLDDVYKIKAEDRIEGGRINLFLGDELSLKNLLYTALVASDNGATIALVNASSLSEEEFVNRMNERAQEMGLTKTSFADPVGLSEDNVSSVREVIMLLKEALRHEAISEALSLSDYSFETLLGREKNIESTDKYLLTDGDNDLIYLGGKTGYIEEAGYCFVGVFLDEKAERYYASVLNSANRYSRFSETKDLIKSLRK